MDDKISWEWDIHFFCMNTYLFRRSWAFQKCTIQLCLSDPLRQYFLPKFMVKVLGWWNMWMWQRTCGYTIHFYIAGIQNIKRAPFLSEISYHDLWRTSFSKVDVRLTKKNWRQRAVETFQFRSNCLTCMCTVPVHTRARDSTINDVTRRIIRISSITIPQQITKHITNINIIMHLTSNKSFFLPFSNFEFLREIYWKFIPKKTTV